MNWRYHNPVEIFFGPGAVDKLPSVERSLIVTTAGAVQRGLPPALQSLIRREHSLVFDGVRENPTIEEVQEAVHMLRLQPISTLIAFGGGSSMDFAKALCFCLANPGVSLQEIFEKNISLHEWAALPWTAIPTTAGTGSEATPFATLWGASSRKKYSLFSPALFARQAFVDPLLCLSLPWLATLASGLDAYSQCFESLWNKNASPVTAGFAHRAIGLIPNALRTLKKNPQDRAARTAMSEASLLSGLAISHTRTALAHSISYPLTAHLNLPHGFACSFTLPAIWNANATAAPDWAQETACALHFKNPAEVSVSMLQLFLDTQVNKEILKVISNYSRVYEWVGEMYTPERAENMLASHAASDIKAVLTRTEELLFS